MALIYDKYTQHQKWDNFRYILMSIVFGIITYLSMQVFIFTFQFLWSIRDTKSINWWVLSIWKVASEKENITINPFETFLGSVLALPLGLLAVFLNKKRSVQSLLVKWGVSNKYGDDNVFYRSIEDMTRHDCTAHVLLLDEHIFISGEIIYYNESEETQELGLRMVSVNKAEDASLMFATNHLYVSKPFGSMIIFKDIVSIGEQNHDSKQESP